MEFLFSAVVAATVCLLWDLLIIAGLRLSGIHLPLRLGRMGGIERETAMVRLGKRGYVFVKGVLLFGCGLFVGITASDYASQKYFGAAHNRLTLISTALGLLIFSGCGVFFGMYGWNNSATPE
jgi:hypothetical protein